MEMIENIDLSFEDIVEGEEVNVAVVEAEEASPVQTLSHITKVGMKLNREHVAASHLSELRRTCPVFKASLW